jgi:ketosteroid isomerase-like protein
MLVILITLMGMNGPDRQTPSTSDLGKVSERWANYWSARQLDQLVELYASDAVFLTGTGDRITGKVVNL